MLDSYPTCINVCVLQIGIILPSPPKGTDSKSTCSLHYPTSIGKGLFPFLTFQSSSILLIHFSSSKYFFFNLGSLSPSLHEVSTSHPDSICFHSPCFSDIIICFPRTPTVLSPVHPKCWLAKGKTLLLRILYSFPCTTCNFISAFYFCSTNPSLQ